MGIQRRLEIPLVLEGQKAYFQLAPWIVTQTVPEQLSGRRHTLSDSIPLLQKTERSTMQLHNQSFEQSVPGRWQTGKVIWKHSSRKSSKCKARNDWRSMKGTNNYPFTLFFQPIEWNFLTFREVEVLWCWKQSGYLCTEKCKPFPSTPKLEAEQEPRKRTSLHHKLIPPDRNQTANGTCTRSAGVKASCAFVLGYFLNSWELAGQPHYSKEQ